ncbi:MAG TPA: hypothetical protein VH165_15110 [Kofleriaceae bacterium]|nr:hypothetical protein [Kofleriaceae bacterium]
MRRCTVAGLGVAAGLGAGCHVMAEDRLTRPGQLERIAHPEAAVAQRPALILDDAGQLRFIEPLACPTEELLHAHTTIERATRPNLATFTVGAIATALGGVMLTSGLFAQRPGASPYTYAGILGVGAGLPLAIGPWIGDRTELAEPPAGTGDTVVRRPGPDQPCGARPLAAHTATLTTGGLEIHGALDADGGFEISPYQWIDAYEAASQAGGAAEITATLAGDAGPRTLTTVLDARALAAHAAGFLAHAAFDARIEPMTLVPGIVAGALRASLIATARGPAVRVVLPLSNAGPGDASGLRGQIAAPGTPAIDGRMIYVGKLARGASVSPELVIPLAPPAAAALRNATIDLSVELRDAHGTAPATPVRFHGALGAPR